MTKKYKKHAVKRENLTNGAFYGIINISLKVKEEKPMKNTKKLLSLLLVMVMIFASNAYALSTSGQFTVEFTADTSIDLSDLKVELYRKTNVVQYTENLQTYDKEFVTSYTSDENGIITFLKPYYDFVLVIDLASLPTGTGVKKSTLLVADNEYYKEIEVETVETVTPSYNGDLNFTFQNKNGENLLVNYEVSGYDVQKTETEKVAVASKIDMNAEAEITVVSKHTGCVSANGKMFSFDFNDTYTYSPTAHTGIDGVSCLTCSGEEASLYAYVPNPSDLTYVQTTIACTSGNCNEMELHNLRVYYDSDDCSLSNANLVLNTLYGVFDFFCNQWKFRCPNSINSNADITNANDSFCLVILLSEHGTFTINNGNNGACVIYLHPSAITADKVGANVAHEFMHCIQGRYNWNDLEGGLKESFANYSGMLYSEYTGDFFENIGDMETGVENYFLNTKISLLLKDLNGDLVTDLRCYSILFPLLLHQYYGGTETIRELFEELYSIRQYHSMTGGTESSADLFEAIDKIVADIYFDGTYQSARDVFENFGLYNYNYSNRYTWFQNSSWTTNASVNEDVLSRSSLSYTKLGQIGYGYYKLSSSPTTVQITLDLYKIYGDYDNCTCYIAEVNNIGSMSNLTKIRMTSDLLNLNYTFSSAANNLCIFVDNLSTVSGDLSVSLTVN